jgi:hypothetical protein
MNEQIQNYISLDDMKRLLVYELYEIDERYPSFLTLMQQQTSHENVYILIELMNHEYIWNEQACPLHI